MKKKIRKETRIEKKLNKISVNLEKVKKLSLSLWTDVKIWNEKNENRLRPFEDTLLSTLVSDLRVIQSEHISALKVLVKDAEK